ncbi:bifunctional demethylmenaquinone methyltransferase/2-methoxy-6-polyprenyl-1,4-benzoquinol methylase UbiE [Hugenholtzia roseola]|uniref:bifunctional demethylmenaquinone methyltransferase/2-methoxy-6-polyprenyl-1,4-benzoquinol methylase UbiE n=1 Tax=Hugenholtzia roseola TaxID=1002 RepID=UPI0003FB40D5|nr:bifunctional demethylmenaquinone methyltransferase/2-methoxy-6-polyprenyl-1,4-benzoquinol methylase UbiE [Hugenholtzia roseola]
MTVLPYKDQELNKKKQVAQMFDNISPKYDLLNHLLSAGIDIAWRKKAVRLLSAAQPKKMLDIATGTADFALEALSLQPDHIMGVDISEGMLEVGRKKIAERNLEDKISLRLGDSENLPFEDNTFDAVIVAFGVRNFENLEKGLAEMLRVLKKGGTVSILEFSQPQVFPIKQFYQLYSHYLLPAIGKTISKDSAAYTYLPESVAAFPYGESFLQIMQKIGYQQTSCTPLTFGISSIYMGKK